MKNFDEKEEARRVKFLENTSYYIETYLNPWRKWNRAASAKQRIDLIRYADVNWAVISDHIRDMDYQEFLATPYWKAIAAHTRYRAGYRCQLCNNNANLSTHHRDYSIHGREHAYIHELIVLCYRCHEKFHGTKEKIVQSGSATTESINSDNKSAGIVCVLIVLILGYFLIWVR